MDAKFLTKKDLISWINHLLSTNVKNIEDLSNGAVFCQLVDKIHPSSKIKKINWSAKLQHQNLSNLKVLSVAMMQAGLQKNFDAARIANKKSMDILELLQWFRKYFYMHSNFIPQSYNPQLRRKSCDRNSIHHNGSNISQQKLKKPQNLSFTKPNKSQKRQPSMHFQQQQQLKTCIRINKAIQRVVYDQKTSSDLKIDMIKGIIFKGSIKQSEVQSKIKSGIQKTHRQSQRLQYEQSQSHKLGNADRQSLETNLSCQKNIKNMLISKNQDSFVKIEEDMIQNKLQQQQKVSQRHSQIKQNQKWLSQSLQKSSQTIKNSNH